MNLDFAPPVPSLRPTAGPTSLDAALRRAFDAARDVPVARSAVPWRFYRVEPRQAQALARLNARPTGAGTGTETLQAAYEGWRRVPGWAVITCLHVDDDEERAQLQERCLTAVQRIALSLWTEAVRTSWITDLVAESEEFYRIVGIDAERERVVGVLWYGHDEEA